MAELERRVAQAAAGAGFAVDVDRCTTHLRALLGTRCPTDVQLSELCLAHACVDAVPAALAALLVVVRDVAARVRWPDADVGDRCTRIWAHVLDTDGNGRVRLATFDGRGPLSAWLRVVAVRLAQADRSHADLEVVDADSLGALWATAAAGTEHDLIKNMYVSQVRDAFARATASLDETTRMLLRLHYRRGVTLESLTGVFGVHRVTLSRRLAAARQQILQRAVAEMTQATAMTEAECQSLMRDLRSRIELSLSALTSSSSSSSP